MDYDKTIEELIEFVDTKCTSTTVWEVYRAFTILIWLMLILSTLFVVFIVYMWITPLFDWLPIGITFAALLIAANSYTISLRKLGKTRLARLKFEKLCTELKDKSEEVKHLLLPLVAMKLENPKMSLHILYRLDKTLFQKEKLLAYYLVSGKQT